ncbi:MAG: response regulator [Planctomycetes bacterium]|nr:response regulator [Planctomycetota bacterium]
MMNSNGNSKTILIVEDEEDFAALLSGLLQERGYRVVIARNSGEALDRLREFTPHLITLDVMMPGRRGGAFYEDLRRNKSTGTIPIVIITGLASAGQVFRRAIETKGVRPPEGYLEKPLNEHSLGATLHCILGS